MPTGAFCLRKELRSLRKNARDGDPQRDQGQEYHEPHDDSYHEGNPFLIPFSYCVKAQHGRSPWLCKGRLSLPELTPLRCKRRIDFKKVSAYLHTIYANLQNGARKKRLVAIGRILGSVLIPPGSVFPQISFPEDIATPEAYLKLIRNIDSTGLAALHASFPSFSFLSLRNSSQSEPCRFRHLRNPSYNSLHRSRSSETLSLRHCLQ